MDTPLKRFKIIETQDNDAANSALAGALEARRLRPTGGTDWRFALSHAPFGRVSITGFAVDEHELVASDVERFSVLLPLRASMAQTVGRQGWGMGPAQTGAILANAERKTRIGGRSRFLIVRTGIADLLPVLDQLHFRGSPRLLVETWHSKPSPPGIEAAKAAVKHVIELVDSAPGQVASMPSFMAAMDEILLLHLGQFATQLSGGAAVDAPQGRLKRAIDYIEENLDGEISLIAVAEAAGTSVRALQYLFRNDLGTTMSGFVQSRRLENAYRRLSQAGRGETVASIAFACGFSHLGEFNRQYQRRYGESPSRTRRSA